MPSAWSPARTVAPAMLPVFLLMVFHPAQGRHLVRADNRDRWPSPRGVRPVRRVNSIIRPDHARDTEYPSRLRVCRARPWIPPFGTRIRVGVEGGDDHGAG